MIKFHIPHNLHYVEYEKINYKLYIILFILKVRFLDQCELAFIIGLFTICKIQKSAYLLLCNFRLF